MTLSMKADIKERWLKELRSGEYEQGAGDLHTTPQGGREHIPERFCCLGILSLMCAQEGAVISEPSLGGYVIAYGASRETSYLPDEVVAWAGLVFEGERQHADAKIEENRGILSNGTHEKFREDAVGLAQLNDSGHSFDEIADVIERDVIGI